MSEIAVVGIDCRLPGAPDTHALWQLLMNGDVANRVVPAERWDVDRVHSDQLRPGTMNTRFAHFIDDVDLFDHEFFGISPVEAAALDPQQRLVLQSAWRAIEDAGLDPRALAGTDAGVFVGMMASEWGAMNMIDYPNLTPQRGMGSGHAMVANRVSYHLNLTGPSVSVDTACSSSLTAVHLGCQALTCGDTDLVVAAGVNLMLSPGLSVFYTQAGLSAPDGRCKPFSADADGIGRGEGVGTVILRRLSDAIADRQPIYSVITGSATNQDGKSSGITAPNRWAQSKVMQRALDRAGVAAADVTFVEAHGTGTVLGDMIEANALGDLHRTGRNRPCLIGSIKGNIGHTEGTAGIAALIKTSLALSHRVLPPTVAPAGSNPALRLEQQGLALATNAIELGDEPVTAGVSSYGLGGSNVHVIMTSPPAAAVRPADGHNRVGVITISAHSPNALRRNAAAFADALDATDDVDVAAFCYSTNRVKSSLKHRFAAAGTRTELIRALHAYADAAPAEEPSRGRPGRLRVGLLCTGQGAQYPGMTRELYETCPPYRAHLARAAAAVDATLDTPSGLLNLMFSDDSAIHQTQYAQPALFAVSYALGAALLELGVKPAFLVGHSVGEFAAAALAEVLTLDEAARLVVARGHVMQQLSGGGAMTAVDVPADEVAALVAANPSCGLAAVNGPRSTVVSGPAEAVDRITGQLVARGAKASSLTVSHAFHSPLMAPAEQAFRDAVGEVFPRKATIPLVSTLHGRVIDGTEMDADYWAAQITSPVLFADAITAAPEPTHLIELGPRSTLLALARRCGIGSQIRTLATCAGPDDDGAGIARVAARLYADGLPTSTFGSLYDDDSLTLKRLPPYVFGDGTRFWRDADMAVSAVSAPVASARPDIDGAATTRTDTVAARVRRVIAEIGGYSPDEIEPNTLLSEDLGYDSLLQLRLVEQLRTEYPELEDASIRDLALTIKDVGDVVRYVEDRLVNATA
ncbi:polyketide synthase family protein [Mycolicibacterium rhodesiae NBB3]|uniref:Polyketide synthase family protein n=1 Tax=Mycolicibacterium rhodesiae (strain NBB3) TaxID=710685 RepID=G8RIS9_MYCRN|nr:type I polyketide synthase [Mycolicibacterium rhodesiae]AEV70917.1 polyketide synthase family protein [Mycolicibacterium rhodesiae NBB3]